MYIYIYIYIKLYIYIYVYIYIHIALTSQDVAGRYHLIQCMNVLVLGSQLPHEIVNLLYSKLIVDKKLTVLWGSCLAQTSQLMHCLKYE